MQYQKAVLKYASVKQLLNRFYYAGKEAAKIEKGDIFTFDKICDILRQQNPSNFTRSINSTFRDYLQLYATGCEYEENVLFVCMAILKVFGIEECIHTNKPLTYIYINSTKKYVVSSKCYESSKARLRNICTPRMLKTFIDFSEAFRGKEDLYSVLNLIELEIMLEIHEWNRNKLKGCRDLLKEYI